MANPTLVINGRDFTSRLASMTVSKEVTYKSVITTRDGVEKVQNQFIRTIIDFSLLPSTPSQIAADFSVLKGTALSVRYYDPYIGGARVRDMRVDGDLQELFMLTSINGQWYYNCKNIKLRQNGVT